jgi:dolichyl-phosphate-mannose--protein O-mannosyl transferase
LVRYAALTHPTESATKRTFFARKFLNRLFRNVFKRWQDSDVTKRVGFGVGLGLIWLFSLVLRFWGLGRFNHMVFDEVYFVRFGHHYLTQTPFFDNHPPLGKYLIGFGIWLGQNFSGSYPAHTWVDEIQLSTLNYRWLNAWVGSFVPLLVAAIAYQLTHRRTYTLIASLLVATDGLLLVESRYGLINIYLVSLGLGGHWLFLIALKQGQERERLRWLLLSGFFLGTTIAVKWNGLGFLLGIYGLWLIAQVRSWGQQFLVTLKQTPFATPFGASLFPQVLRRLPYPLHASQHPEPELFQQLRQLHWSDLAFELGLWPLLIYRLVWIPHLVLNPNFDFWQSQAQSLNSHAHVVGNDIHPYCSQWYSWPLLLRPVAYWYERQEFDTTGLTSGANTAGTWIYDVHALGNPVLWWLSSMAILTVLLTWGHWLRSQMWRLGQVLKGQSRYSVSIQPIQYQISPSHQGVLIYLTVNYLANWLPWVGVSRCLFLYHYMAASIFSFLTLAWLVDQWLHQDDLRWHFWAWGVMVGTMVALAYWLPIYLGLPLTPEALNQRMWLPSWP